MSQPIGADLSETTTEQIETTLSKILASPEFTANDRRRDFLQFVIAEALDGRGDQLKGYTIGAQAFGLGDDFDPSEDPIVRLEARRLRRELSHYFLTDGRHDPIEITIPKGAYSPHVEARQPAPAEEPEPGVVHGPDAAASDMPPAGNAPARRVPHWLLGLAVAALAPIALWWLITGRTGTPQVEAGKIPIVAVLPFEAIDQQPATRIAAAGLAEDVITDLTRIPGLFVIAHSSSQILGNRAADPEDLASELGVTHVLRGILQASEGDFRLNASLIETRTRQELWAERFDYTASEKLKTQIEISRRISSTLAGDLLAGNSVFPQAARFSSPYIEAMYKQASSIIHPPSDPARYAASRILMERIRELDPNSTHGHGGLAFVDSHALWFGTLPLDAASVALTRRNARTALDIDPGNDSAWVSLATVEMLEGKHDEAVKLARRAVKAQPSSGYAQGYLGVFLTFAGRPEEAIEPVEIALSLDPLDIRRPYRNILVVANFHAGNFKRSSDLYRENQKLGGPIGPHMLAYQVANYRELGETERERTGLRQLSFMLAASGDFRPENWLRNAAHDEAMIQPLLSVLGDARAAN